MKVLSKDATTDRENVKLDELKTCLVYIAVTVAMGVLVYLSLMANDLVNNLDGIWHPSNFIAGDWEISLGRGLQRYADRARFGLVSSAWNSVVFFAIWGLADYLIIRKFNLRTRLYSFLFLFVTIANPVVCESLTYSYMSINFALAYLLAVIAFAIVPKQGTSIKNRILLLVTSSLAFGMSMAFYQAYICVFAVISLFWIVTILNSKEKLSRILIESLGYIITFILGGAIYYCIAKLLLIRAGVEMASYKGAGNITPGVIIRSFPQSILNAYKETYNFIFIRRFNSNLEFSSMAIIVVVVITLICFITYVIGIFKNGVKNGLISILLFAFLPLAGSCICAIAVGNSITGLMAMGILLIVPLSYIFVKDKKALKIVFACSIFLLSWYTVSAVENDQIALKEGSVATERIADGILNDINDYCSDEPYNCVAIVGRASDNPLFYASEAYEMANGYAMFGRWSTDARNNRVTWDGIMKSMCGTHLQFCDDGKYLELIESNSVKSMPIYPADGYIQSVDGVLVIKVSNVY